MVATISGVLLGMPTPTLVLRLGFLRGNTVTTPFIHNGDVVTQELQDATYTPTSPVFGTDGNLASDAEWKVFASMYINSVMMGTIFKNMFYDAIPLNSGYGGFGSVDLTSTPA